MVGRANLTRWSLFFSFAFAAAGCGDMWGDLFGSKQGAGMLADGSTGPTCTRATHQQLLSSLNTSCTLSSQCPSGAFCDIDVGGFCNFQCEDSNDCPSNQVCNCLGQCVGDLPPDGGAPPDPACPKNLALINQVTSTESGKRTCKFDDVCPYGTFCDDKTGTCSAECTSDSECTLSDGGTRICNCLGRCDTPGSAVPPPRTNGPSLTVTPRLIELVLPADGVIPVKPTFAPRDLEAHLRSTVSKIINGGQTGGPPVAITVKAGKYLDVQCRVPCSGVNCETVTYTTAAKECPLLIGEDNWSPDHDDVVAMHPVRVLPSSEQPAQDEESMRAWTVTFQSADTAQSTTVVNLVYSFHAPASSSLTDVIANPVTLSGGFTGFVELLVRDQTPTFNDPDGHTFPFKVPVYGIGRGNIVYMFDPSLLLSSTGVIYVAMNSVPGQIISWVDSQPEIGTESMSMRVNEAITTSEFLQDPVAKTLTGSFQIKNLMFSPLSNAYFSGRFMLKPDIMPSCDPADTTLTQIECPAGTGCVQGFCTNPVPLPPIYTLGDFFHLQEFDYLDNNFQRSYLDDAADQDFLNADNLLCQIGQFPNIGPAGMKMYRDGAPEDFTLPDVFKNNTVNGFLKLSGDAPCFALASSVTGNSALVGTRAVPLLTNADSAGQKKTWISNLAEDRLNALGASDLLGRCLSEIKRRAPGVEPFAVPPPSSNASTNLGKLGKTYFETELGANSCVSLGNFFGTLEVARHQGDWSAYGLVIRQWLELHSFIGSQGLEESQLNLVLQSANAADQLGSETPSSPVNYDKLLDVMESGIWFAMTNLGKVILFDVPTPQNVQAFDASLVNPDYREGTGIPQTAANPQYEQPAGFLPAFLEALTAELRVATAFMADANLKTYEESINQFSPIRAAAIRRYGFAIRSALLAQNLAVNLHDRAVFACGHTVTPCTTLPWEQRWKTALEAFRVARQEIVSEANRLVRVENPLGIYEFDVPIFFGDPVGTNSKYFASSDYLLDKWAAPAVQTASNELEQARQAWVSQRNSKLQDELSTADRDRRLDQLAEQYGRPLIQDCGFETVDGASVDGKKAIDLITSGRTSAQNCYVDPSCAGFENAWNGQSLVARVVNQMNDLTIRFSACMAANTKVSPPTFPSRGATYTDSSEDPEIAVQTSASLDGDIDCLTRNPDTLHLVVVPGGENIVRGMCGTRSIDITLTRWLAFGVPNGPELPDQVRRANQICTERYGYKPTPVPAIPPHCLKGRMGEAVGASISAGNGLSKAITDLSITQQEVSAKAEFCLTLDQNEANRIRFSQVVHAQLADAIQTSINAAATAQIGSLEGWITQILVNQWQDIKKGIEHGGDYFDRALRTLSGWGNSALGALGFGGGGGGGPPPTGGGGWRGGGPPPPGSGWRGGAAQGAEDAKRWVLGYHSNGLATDFATQAEAVAQEGVFRELDATYRELVDAQRSEEESGRCWLEYHAMKIGMDSQLAVIRQNMTEVQRAAVGVANVGREITSLAATGSAAIEREKNRKWNGYAFHYWTAEKVDRFKKDFEWAKRLTFLAARAVEYEFQQSLPFRSTVLTAHHPDQLAEVVRILQQEQAARTINRRRPEEASVVMSLRDDILRISDRSSAPDGERNWTPAQRFKGRLRNTAYTVRDNDGNIMGQGIPFTMDPLAGAGTSGVGLKSRCGERLWRVTATIQGDGLSSREPGASVLLLKRNSFHSQFCADHGSGMPMQSVSIQPSRQLFRPDDQSLPNDQSFDFTGSQLYPWFNIRRTDFYKKSFQDGASEELAGRGLYGDYVLIFPQNLLDAGFPIERVEDVLVRFDYLSVDNLTQIAKSN